MKRKEKHDSKVSKGEGMKMRQPNKKEFLNKMNKQDHKWRLNFLEDWGFKGEFLKVINFQQLGKQKNKTKSLKDELTATGKTDKPNQIQQG